MLIDNSFEASTSVTQIEPKPKYDWEELWGLLHVMRSPSRDKLLRYIESLPKFCGCESHFLQILDLNPPRYNDWDRWSWEVHNLVNARVHPDRPAFTWEQYAKRWLQWLRHDGCRIGFAVVGYEPMGGTETFHQTLVPRLPGVIGFASQCEMRGDTAALRVSVGEGRDAIKSISYQSDVVVSWNIDWSLLRRPKRLITVHHGSIDDTQGTSLATQGDLIVAVNEDVASLLRTLTDKPVHHIPNAVDTDRLKSRNAVDTRGKKICLWAHRFSREKRPELAVRIAEQLPLDWHMVMTGYRDQQITPSDRVTLLPPQHPGDWLTVASCFLSAAEFEGFGLSVAEAITAGVPVVSSSTGIASRPGLAITLPPDASTSDWAKAVVASGDQTLPSRDLFSLGTHLKAWQNVVRLAAESVD